MSASNPEEDPGPYLLLLQGLYYGMTGLWALVNVASFQKVTGPKTDLWLVKTVGVLVLVIGAVLFLSGLRRTKVLEIAFLAAGCAAGLAVIDGWYVAQGVLSRVYLLDALAEALFVVLWLSAVPHPGPGRRADEESKPTPQLF